MLAVHRGVKFSCHFTLTEITERWYALLYDKSVSRLALAALRNLHPQTVAAVQAKALYTKAEEQLLASISSVTYALLNILIDPFLINYYFFIDESTNIGKF